MKVLIVDDEPLARDRLRRMLEKLPGYSVAGEAENGEQAVALCNELQPDIVLLDIRMPVMDGINAARVLAAADKPPAVIFCTAYGDYAVDAFDANAVGYLLKPVAAQRLEEALAKARKPNRAQLAAVASQDPAPGERTHISAKSHRGMELVPVEEVRYFVADQKYVTAVHAGGQLLIDDTLKELEDQLGDRFLRVHRNALVAIAHVQGLEREDSGQYRVRLSGIEEGPVVSRRHLASVRKRLAGR